MAVYVGTNKINAIGFSKIYVGNNLVFSKSTGQEWHIVWTGSTKVGRQNSTSQTFTSIPITSGGATISRIRITIENASFNNGGMWTGFFKVNDVSKSPNGVHELNYAYNRLVIQSKDTSSVSVGAQGMIETNKLSDSSMNIACNSSGNDSCTAIMTITKVEAYY